MCVCSMRRVFHPHLNNQGHSCLEGSHWSGPRDQIIRSGSRHFGHYVKDRMIANFLIGPSTVEVCCDWFVRFTQNP